MAYDDLSTFAVVSEGFSMTDKVKLILFSSGAKPAASVYLDITPKNLDEKERFEQILEKNKIPFLRGRERSFEVVDYVKGGTVHWVIGGTYIDYDLFSSAIDKKKFSEYKKMAIKDIARSKRARIAGKIYGYPKCCIEQYVRETSAWLKKNMTYHDFYERLNAADKKYPFIPFSPCSAECRQAKNLNQKYSATVRKYEPKFWRQFVNKQEFRTDLVIDHESIVTDDNNKDIFPNRKWHNYVVLALKQYKGRYYFYSFLTRKKYEHGAVLSGKVTMQYGRGFVQPGKAKRIMKLRHIRKLPMLGRK